MCIFIVIISVETIFGNVLVLLSFYTDRKLRQPSNAFIASLAVSDLLIGIEGYPITTYYELTGQWSAGQVACDLWLTLDFALCLVSIFAVLLITADRYLMVCHTVCYRNWQNMRRVQILIVVSWVVPLLFFTLMIFGWDKPSNSVECVAPFIKWPFLNMFMYLAYYWVILAAMVWMYYLIHTRVEKLSGRHKNSTVTVADEESSVPLASAHCKMVQAGIGMLMTIQDHVLELGSSEGHVTTSGGAVTQHDSPPKDSGIDVGADAHSKDLGETVMVKT